MQCCHRSQAARPWRDVLPWQRSWQTVTGRGYCTSRRHKTPHGEGASLNGLAATNPIQGRSQPEKGWSTLEKSVQI